MASDTAEAQSIPQRADTQSEFMVAAFSGVCATGLLPQAIADVAYTLHVSEGDLLFGGLGLAGVWGVVSIVRDSINKKRWGRLATVAAGAAFGAIMSISSLTDSGMLNARFTFNTRAQAVEFQKAKARAAKLQAEAEKRQAEAVARAAALRADNLAHATKLRMGGECVDAKYEQEPGKMPVMTLPRGCRLVPAN